MTRHPAPPSTAEIYRVAGVVLALATLGLAYEVLLTRLFSLIFQYHYVFLIVSLAVLGLGIGAGISYATQRWVTRRTLSGVALALSVALVGIAVGLARLSSADLTIPATLAALVPFLALGWLNSSLFTRYAERSAFLYGADLLGAVIGLIGALVLVPSAGAFGGILLLASVAALVALVLMWDTRSALLMAGASVLLIAGLGLAAFGGITFDPAQLDDAPPDKTMVHVLQDPSTGADLLETRWSTVARVDLVSLDDEALRYVFSDAGAGSVMIQYDPDAPETASWLRSGFDYLPFAMTENPGRVLILGAGAGKDVVQAKLAGADEIVAVEINPTMVDLTNDYADYTGDVFHLPGVEVAVTDGRNFIDRTDEHYDLIYLNLVYSQAATPSSVALVENYIFTREALESYWQHLDEDGRIGVVTHNGPEGIRLFLGAIDMLQAEGYTLREALDHVTLTARRTDDAQARNTILTIDRDPWTEERATALRDLVAERGMSILYIPHTHETLLGGLATGEISLDDYIAGNPEFNYTPTTDNQPFFYHLRPGLPDGLADLLRAVGILGLLYAAFVMVSWKPGRDDVSRRMVWFAYFSLIGAAFMLVEIPLIQRFSLLLGIPAVSLVTVLGSLLLGGSAGSFFTTRYAASRLRSLILAATFVTGLAVIVVAFVYPALIDLVLPAGLGLRVAFSILLIAPVGFAMGIAFPNGLRLAHLDDPRGIPVHWGANAVASTIGSVLATALAVSYGFQMALLLGATLYVLVALLTWRFVGRKKTYAVS